MKTWGKRLYNSEEEGLGISSKQTHNRAICKKTKFVPGKAPNVSATCDPGRITSSSSLQENAQFKDEVC